VGAKDDHARLPGLLTADLTERVNAYDERHLPTYVRLLMAEEEGPDWREVVLVLFGLDPTREPDRAKNRP